MTMQKYVQVRNTPNLFIFFTQYNGTISAIDQHEIAHLVKI